MKYSVLVSQPVEIIILFVASGVEGKDWRKLRKVKERAFDLENQ